VTLHLVPSQLLGETSPIATSPRQVVVGDSKGFEARSLAAADLAGQFTAVSARATREPASSAAIRAAASRG